MARPSIKRVELSNEALLVAEKQVKNLYSLSSEDFSDKINDLIIESGNKLPISKENESLLRNIVNLSKDAKIDIQDKLKALLKELNKEIIEEISLVMTSLLLSQGVAYTNYDAEKEIERKIDKHYNGNVSSAARQSMENLEKQINRNKTVNKKIINPIELNSDDLIDIEQALDREYEKGRRDGYDQGYKEGYDRAMKDKRRR